MIMNMILILIRIRIVLMIKIKIMIMLKLMVMIMIMMLMITSPHPHSLPTLSAARGGLGEKRGGADGGGEQFLFSFPIPPLFSPPSLGDLAACGGWEGENGRGQQFLPTLPSFWL